MPFGVGRDVSVSWILPTWLEAFVLVGALARLRGRAEPDAPDLRSAKCGSSRSRRTRLIVTPSEWRGFDYQAMSRSLVARARRARVRQVAPEGDPSTLPPFVPAADEASAPVRWIFYLGHHRRSEGRAMPIRRCGRRRTAPWSAASTSPTRTCSGSSSRTHIGGQTWTFTAHDRVPARVQRNVRARGDDPDPARGRPDARRCGHAVPHGVSRRAAPAPEG